MSQPYRRKAGGSFYIDWIENGKRQRKSLKTTDRARAEEEQKKLDARLMLGLKTVPTANLPRIRLKKFTEAYFEHVVARHAASYAVNVRHALAHLAQSLGNPNLHQVTKKAVEDHVTALTATFAISTVNGEIKIMRAAMNKAVDWGYLYENPFKGVKFLKDASRDHKVVFLSEEEVERLLRQTKGHALHDIFGALYYTGLRREELVNLWWEDLDFDQNVLHVRIKDWIHEAGKKSHWHPKGRRELTIPMHSKLRIILQRQPRRGRNVFTNERGSTFAHSLSMMVNRWQKRSGWRVTCHMMRHTFASHLVQQGVSLYVVGELLGHSGPEITQIYAHLVPKKLGHVVELLGKGKGPSGGGGHRDASVEG